MAYEWGRFMWWLQAYSGALQALSSALSVVASIVLVIITARYVKLTHGMLEASEASVRGGFLPDLKGDFGVDWTSKRRDIIAVSISNAADVPTRIMRAKVMTGMVYRWATQQENAGFAEEIPIKPCDLPEFTGRFLRHKEQQGARFKLLPQRPFEESDWLTLLEKASFGFIVQVECSDITGRVVFSIKIYRFPALSETRVEARFPSTYDTDEQGFLEASSILET